jgi:hypothetical protein
MRKKPPALALAWSPIGNGPIQITAKFSQAWQSQATLPPNPAKEKAWIFLDSLGRFEPFERVTPTPPPFFSFSSLCPFCTDVRTPVFQRLSIGSVIAESVARVSISRKSLFKKAIHREGRTEPGGGNDQKGRIAGRSRSSSKCATMAILRSSRRQSSWSVSRRRSGPVGD